jgi:phosphoglycolate phosphatase
MRGQSGRSAILIDLDGTLTDPAPGILAGFRFAMASLGREIPAGYDLLSMIGPPIRRSFAQLLGGPDDVEIAVTAYRDYIGRQGLTEARVYGGIPQALGAMRAAHDGALFLCTAKSIGFAQRTIEHFGLAGYFRGVYGAELGGRFEDKGDLIEHILQMEGLDASAVCMIGDRSHDIVAAKRHAIPTIGVTWGYGSVAELEDAGVTQLCDEVATLPACVAEILAG